MKKLNKQNKDYLSWDEYFMGIAVLSTMRSKDPNTRVGACIVSKDNRILSIGYNGAPNGYKDDVFPWDREGDPKDTKYFYVCHSELNAILNYGGSRSDLVGSKLYVTLFPCNECAKVVVQSGIKEVIYLSEYHGTDATVVSKKIFDVCGVKYRQFDGQSKNIVINLD